MGFLFMAASFYSWSALAQKRCSELPADAQTEIQSGKVLSEQTEVSGKSWPQVTVYSKVPRTSKETMALFCNFNLHKEIFPDLVESKIASFNPDSLSWDVDYKMKLLLGSETYSVRNKLQVIGPEFNSLKLEWNSIKAEKMKSNQGFVFVEQLADGFVCMTYSNLVDLGDIPGVGLLKGMQLKKTKEALVAFLNYLKNVPKSAETLRILDPLLKKIPRTEELLKTQSGAVR